MLKDILLTSIFICNMYFGWSQIINIPDANFKNALLNTACADFNGNGVYSSQVDLNNNDEIELSEVLGVQGLRVWNQDIVSVEGIENFVNLTHLNVTFNDIETMDISALTHLSDLWCYGNELTALDVSSNLSLENLYCNENQITELDVTLNTSLVNLEFYLNNISEIDVTLNSNLETLYCGNNPMSQLDVTHNLLLKGLLMSNTLITEIDLTQNVLLEDFSASHNNMPSIDLSQNINLLTVNLSSNLLTDIDVSNNPELFELNVQNNNLINANIKNGSAFMMYSSFFGNPDLEYICADDFEIDMVQAELDLLGYTETLVSDDCDLGVNEYELMSQVKVYPVPFNDELFIQSKEEIQKLTIFKSNGQQIFEVTPVAWETYVDTKTLSSGVYVIKIETVKGVEFKKIIKK